MRCKANVENQPHNLGWQNLFNGGNETKSMKIFSWGSVKYQEINKIISQDVSETLIALFGTHRQILLTLVVSSISCSLLATFSIASAQSFLVSKKLKRF